MRGGIYLAIMNLYISNKKSKNKYNHLTVNENKYKNENDHLKELADKDLVKKDYIPAQEKYKKIISSSPQKIPLVLQSYERLLVKDLENVSLKMSLVDISFFIEDWNEARYELEEVIELDPSNIQAYLLLARILQRKDIKDVVRLFEKAYNHVDEDEIIDGLVSSYVQTKDYQKAIHIYSKMLDKKEQSPKVIKILAELYTKNKEYNKATETYLFLFKNDKACLDEVVQKLEELLQYVPDNIFIMEALAETYLAEMKPELSLKMLEQTCVIKPELCDETIKKIKKILSAYPDFIPAVVSLAYMYLKKHLYSEAVMCFTKLMKDNSRYIEEAIMGYQRVLEQCPEQVLARQYLGEAFLSVRRIDEAVEEFSKLIEYNGQDAGFVMTKCRSLLKENEQYPGAHLLLAKCYYVRNEYKKAYDECLSLISNGNSDHIQVENYKLLVQVCYHLEKYEDCKKYLYAIIEFNEKEKDLHDFCNAYAEKIVSAKFDQEKILEQSSPHLYNYYLGQKYYLTNKLEDSIKAFQISARESKYAGLSYYYLGLCFKARGRFDLAINQLSRAFEYEKEANNYAAMNAIKYQIGLAYESMGDLKSATEKYERILENDISFSSVKTRIKEINSMSWANTAGKALLGIKREYENSEMIVVWAPNKEQRNLVKKDKRAGMVMDISFSQSHNDEGVNHFLKGRIKAAEEEFLLAMQLDQSLTIIYNNLGLLYLEKQNNEEAKKFFEKALEDNPDMAIIYANMGLMHYMSGEMESARELYNKAIALDPKLSNALLNLGDICYHFNEVDKALEYWEQAYSECTLPELARKRLLFKKSSFKLEEELIDIK